MGIQLLFSGKVEITTSLEEKIKRLNIVDIVESLYPGRFKLKDYSPHNAGWSPHPKGLCVFHKERTPSLTLTKHFPLSDRIKPYASGFNRFYCFGCHASGDIFDFLFDSWKSYAKQLKDTKQRIIETKDHAKRILEDPTYGGQIKVSDKKREEQRAYFESKLQLDENNPEAYLILPKPQISISQFFRIFLGIKIEDPAQIKRLIEVLPHPRIKKLDFDNKKSPEESLETYTPYVDLGEKPRVWDAEKFSWRVSRPSRRFLTWDYQAAEYM